ncbi:MAG: DUF7064 domain-containing protein [Acidimicrobiia bacterium]
MTTRFTARDDLLHDVSASGPHARESLALTAPLPDEQLLVFAYLWRERGERWGRFLFVGGPDMHKPLFVSFDDQAAFSGGDLDDCVIGGVRLRQPEPLRVAELDFAHGDLELSLRLEGVHEPFSWHDNRGGCPSWVADDRYEQSCRTRGTLTVGTRRVKIAGGGHRDHSWGSRNWAMLQHWKWMNAIAADDLSLHAMIMHAKGELLVNGYLNRDGVVSPIVTAEAAADLDDQMIHRALTARFTDEAGRHAALECTYAAGWQMPIGHLVLNEVGMAATLDGRPAVAHIEFGWPADYVRALTGE